MKGMVFGILARCYKHNSVREDYIHFAGLLYKRLLARGHNGATLRPLFLQAHCNAKAAPAPIAPASVPPNNDKQRLFLHFEYHP